MHKDCRFTMSLTLHFAVSISASRSVVVITQTPVSLPISLRDQDSISCRSSQTFKESSRIKYLEQYLQKTGQSPYLMIHKISKLFSGMSERFNVTGPCTYLIAQSRSEEKSGASGFCSRLLLPRFTYSSYNELDINQNILACNVLAATYSSYLCEREVLRNSTLLIVVEGLVT